MYVCVCNGVTDKDIQREVEAGCETIGDLTMRTGAGANCGSCVQLAETLMTNMRASKAVPVLELSVPVLTSIDHQLHIAAA